MKLQFGSGDRRNVNAPRNLHSASCGNRRVAPSHAFSLLEVMIAMALFFMAVFAILDLTSQSLAAARGLQRTNLDVGSLATGLLLTNRVEEGSLPPQITSEFEELNPGYTCTGNISEVSSNGLFQVDFEIYGIKGKKVAATTMSILLFRPESASRSSSAGLRR
jgi:Tfp pilus assembly protein PilV